MAKTIIEIKIQNPTCAQSHFSRSDHVRLSSSRSAADLPTPAIYFKNRVHSEKKPLTLFRYRVNLSRKKGGITMAKKKAAKKKPAKKKGKK
jgi:hypothetical protein